MYGMHVNDQNPWSLLAPGVITV